jgi:hypothetical protein
MRGDWQRRGRLLGESDEGVGVLRLRQANRFALGLATLRMTTLKSHTLTRADSGRSPRQGCLIL